MGIDALAIFVLCGIQIELETRKLCQLQKNRNFVFYYCGSIGKFHSVIKVNEKDLDIVLNRNANAGKNDNDNNSNNNKKNGSSSRSKNNNERFTHCQTHYAPIWRAFLFPLKRNTTKKHFAIVCFCSTETRARNDLGMLLWIPDSLKCYSSSLSSCWCWWWSSSLYDKDPVFLPSILSLHCSAMSNGMKICVCVFVDACVCAMFTWLLFCMKYFTKQFNWC